MYNMPGDELMIVYKLCMSIEGQGQQLVDGETEVCSRSLDISFDLLGFIELCMAR